MKMFLEALFEAKICTKTFPAGDIMALAQVDSSFFELLPYDTFLVFYE